MSGSVDPALEDLEATILVAFPDLRDARFTLLDAGWDSIAVDVDDRLIFKFPRHEAARRNLEKEASVLAGLRPP